MSATTLRLGPRTGAGGDSGPFRRAEPLDATLHCVALVRGKHDGKATAERSGQHVTQPCLTNDQRELRRPPDPSARQRLERLPAHDRCELLDRGAPPVLHDAQPPQLTGIAEHHIERVSGAAPTLTVRQPARSLELQARRKGKLGEVDTAVPEIGIDSLTTAVLAIRGTADTGSCS